MELSKEEIMHFVTIGYVEWRKGQDVLIDAIRKLPQNKLELCEFLFVGQDSSRMAVKLKAETRNIPQVRFEGMVDRDRIKDIIKHSDVMIIPSREDPMPTVAVEAMSNKVPCIVSNVTGTADYISDGENGLIFSNEDSSILSEKIVWCIDNYSYLKAMGNKAYEIFRDKFSMVVFAQNILEIVRGMLDDNQ